MRGINHCAQSLFAHMGVVLRRREIGMAQQFLHRAQIGPTIEQMRREGVSQRMRMCRRRRPPIKKAPNIARSQSSSSAIEEDRIRGRRWCRHNSSSMTEPLFEGFDRRRAQRNNTLL